MKPISILCKAVLGEYINIFHQCGKQIFLAVKKQTPYEKVSCVRDNYQPIWGQIISNKRKHTVFAWLNYMSAFKLFIRQGDCFYLEIEYYCGCPIICINVQQKRCGVNQNNKCLTRNYFLPIQTIMTSGQTFFISTFPSVSVKIFSSVIQ